MEFDDMPTFRFNKLIRDNLPAFYADLEQTIVTRKLTKHELLLALRDKLVEEAKELPFESNTRADIVNELSDVEQVMDDIRTQLNISAKEITEAKRKKAIKKGGFSAGVFVEQIHLLDDDEWVGYYRAEPAKYPEISENGHSDPELPEIEKGTYRHTKSNRLYEVIGITFNTETNEPLVIYRPLYEHPKKYEMFARPYDMFFSTVEDNGKQKPRFEKCS